MVMVFVWPNSETALIHDPQNCGERLVTSPCLSVCLSIRLPVCVRSHGTARLPLDGFSWNLIFEIFLFFENISRKFKIHYTPIRIAVTVHEDQYTSMIISRSLRLRMRNVSGTVCRENQNKYIEKIQDSLHSNKNSGYCAWRPIHIYDHISLTSS